MFFTHHCTAYKNKTNRFNLPFSSPVVSSNDTCLLPATFEGAMLTSKDINNLILQSGRLEQIRFNSAFNYHDFAGKRIGDTRDDFIFGGGTAIWRTFIGSTTVALSTRFCLESAVAEVRFAVFEKY